MLTSLGSILRVKGINPADTPYLDVCDYYFDTGDFFKIEKIDAYKSNLALFNHYEKELSYKSASIREKLSDISDRIKQAKTTDQSGKTLRNLRAKKKELSSALTAIASDFYESKPEKYVITFKNMLIADTFENISELVSPLGKAKYERLKDMPLFTQGLNLVNEDSLENIGIEGGPCLFGTDEMIVEVTHIGGKKYYFDFNTGKNYNNELSVDIAEHFIRFAEKISNVSFDSRKRKLTLQEYEVLAFPMEVADILNAPFVFLIPDMSYKKFLSSISTGINPTVRACMIEEFTYESHRITDMYLELFHRLLKTYKLKKYTILHERDNTTLNYFYEEREKYFKRRNHQGAAFTSRIGKEESVYDYISCVAAPYYFWKTKNILQVDSIDEADCMRKCVHAHRKIISFSSILFPEILSKNGIDTIFNAKREYKIYI